MQLARHCGFKVAHFRPARVRRGGRETYETPVAGDGKGWPDLFMVHRRTGRVVVAELKIGRNEPTPEQEDWLALFKLTDAVVRVWYDTDWADIEAVLRGVGG
jgi:hypothetical protein